MYQIALSTIFLKTGTIYKKIRRHTHRYTRACVRDFFVGTAGTVWKINNVFSTFVAFSHQQRLAGSESVCCVRHVNPRTAVLVSYKCSTIKIQQNVLVQCKVDVIISFILSKYNMLSPRYSCKYGQQVKRIIYKTLHRKQKIEQRDFH